MRGHWAIPIIVSILILGSLGLSQQAFAVPITVSHVDSVTCDVLVVPSRIDELGTTIAFPPGELITAIDFPTGAVACPGSDTAGTNVLVRITNTTPFDFDDVWYIAETTTSIANIDGLVLSHPSFKIIPLLTNLTNVGCSTLSVTPF